MTIILQIYLYATPASNPGLCFFGSAFVIRTPPLSLISLPLIKEVIAMKIAKGKGTARTEKKEVLIPVEDRKIGKRKAAIKANESSKKRAKKENITKKDPNRPKRPPSAFFVFLEEFRKVYKQEHPNVKAVSAVGKAGGEKWKSLSAAEKAPYEAKAAKRKTEYEKVMTAYNKKQEMGGDGDDDVEQSHGSKSEVNGQDDDDDEESDEEDEEDDEDD
ncbi:unnamed protein product [Dovyalis caffra]|uniref:HMG box domain-containing protein n=1 Tax=Dovyalis caffra TaxID=77055 RepID=A0AAV1QXS2_9ROSI|nr:unnamed protein product [Dovyalis caffra]